MSELLHRLHDVRHSLDTVESPGEGLRHLAAQIFQSVFPGQLIHPQEKSRASLRLREMAYRIVSVCEELVDVLEGAAQEVHAVADVLNRGIDFVGNAGGEPADGLQ